MIAPKLEFPALYHSANNGSTVAQRKFLWTIRGEYILLFCVSVAGVFHRVCELNPLFISLLLFILAGLFLFKVVKKLDQDWYRCRALAESVKTSTWRFSMRSHPFQDTKTISIPKENFRNLLTDILKANRHIAQNLTADDTYQVTESMIAIRKLSISERLSYYVKNRINDQQNWYKKKSAENKRAFRFWIYLTLLIYLGGLISLNAHQFGMPLANFFFDPFIVLATSAIGWLQMKRHGELIASYNLTAHEIGIIKIHLDSVETEESLSDFVNEAEIAFSREHTQWVARRDAN